MFLFFLFFSVIFDVQAQLSECGTVSPNGKEVPWQAGVYNTGQRSVYSAYDYSPVSSNSWRCGASLISRKVVITAGHELWLEAEDTPVEPSSIAVAVGKLSRLWKEPEDEDTQTSEVQELHLSPKFKHRVINAVQVYVYDIAVIIVKDAFRYNEYIQPVCIDFNYRLQEQQLNTIKKGKAIGWSERYSGQRTPDFIVKELFFVKHERHCFAILSYGSSGSAYAQRGSAYSQRPSAYSQRASSQQKVSFLDDEPDPTCDYRDELLLHMQAKQNDSVVCNEDGDGGIGVAYPSTERGIERYYLRGVFSLPVDVRKQCTTNTYFGFTSLHESQAFIKKYWNETEESFNQIGKCVLPPFPEHGNYTSNVKRVNEGDHLVVTLTISCESGYGVSGAASVSCYNGFWPDAMPTCVRMCQLTPHPSLDYRCIVTGSEVSYRECGTSEPIGTRVIPQCREPHFYSPNNLPVMKCKEDGQWNYIAVCVPECGRVTPDGKELVVGGVRAKKGQLPWHAGIYSKVTTPYMQICGGSLISDRLIISAAHCFWTSTDKQLPASNYAVAVGKIYRPWDDVMDEAQKSDVEDIHIPARYQGAATNFQDDIAIVIVATPFEFKTFVRPVCLSFSTFFDTLQLKANTTGKVAGWGLTASNGKAAPVLQVVELPYVEIGTCIENSPEDFIAIITSDKICAGTLTTDKALCKGDSGGGLAFPSKDRGVERHYLRGVVSTAPSNNDACNTHTYTGFTHILKHIDFIKQFLTDV